MEDEIYDWRLCWLACSTFWNLARAAVARNEIGIRGVALIEKLMTIHGQSSLVMQTAYV